MQKRLTRIFTLAMGIPMLLALLVACGSGTTGNGSSSTPTTGSKTIEIATDLPSSGKDTSSGKPAENGAHLAVDQANANNTIPGYHLVFVAKDDVGPKGIHDPAVGVQNVRALIGDGLVAGIVGPFNSSVGREEMPVANRAPIALLSPANTNQCLTRTGADIDCGGPNDILQTVRPTNKVTYFRIATTDDHQGPVNADYLYNTYNFKNAYVIDDAETYGVGIADTFTREWQKLGGKVLGRSSEQSSTTSYVSLLTQIASQKPDVIYFGGLDSTGGILLRQQMQQVAALKNTPFAGGDGLVTATFASTIGTGGGPVYATVATVDVTKNPSAADFVQKYQSTYGTLGAYSAAGYDCANIMIQAVKAAIKGGAQTPQNSGDSAGAKTFRQAVIDALQKVDYNGVTGHHTFDQNGDTTDKIITIEKTAGNNKPGWTVVKAVTVS